MPSFEKTLSDMEALADYLYDSEAAAGAKIPDNIIKISTPINIISQLRKK